MHQVRVNFRGIYTRPPKAVLRDLVGLGWLSAPCNLSYASLCRYAWGDAFPSGAPEATDTPGGLPAAWAALGCSNGQGKVYTGAPEYDLSACDVVDQALPIFYPSSTRFLPAEPGCRGGTWCTPGEWCTISRAARRWWCTGF